MSEKRVGVIGYPVDHSLSPAMHNAAFSALGMTDWFYDKIALPPDIVRLGLRELRDHGYIGINVTVPHKQAVMPFVKPDERAKAIGAVNTIDFRGNRATNTDVIGFMDDLAVNEIDPTAAPVIVLGAGGSARAVVYGLTQVGAQVVIVNRTRERAQTLLDELCPNGFIADDFDSAILLAGDLSRHAPLIVNCTSVGLTPQVDHSPIPDDACIPPGSTVYDLIYRPAQTKLMTQVEAAGGRAVGGLGMLVRQGAAAFALWTGVQPPIDVMTEAAQAALYKG